MELLDFAAATNYDILPFVVALRQLPEHLQCLGLLTQICLLVLPLLYDSLVVKVKPSRLWMLLLDEGLDVADSIGDF